MTSSDDIKRQLKSANLQLLIGYCFAIVGTVMFVVRVVTLSINSDDDTVYWIVFAIGICIKIVGWSLIIPARRKRFMLLRKLHMEVAIGSQQPQPLPPVYITSLPPPAYNYPGASISPYNSQFPSSAPQSGDLTFNDPPPPYNYQNN